MIHAMTPPELPDLEKAARLLSDFGRLWEHATAQERKQVLNALLDTVYLDQEHGPVVAIVPKPQYQSIFGQIRGRRDWSNDATRIQILAPGELPG